MCQAPGLNECPLLLQSVLGKSMCSARGSLAENRQEDLGFQTTNLGRVLAECNPYFSAVAVQINEKLSFETDVAVLFTFIVPNTLHILGLTSWSTCCYMSINHFLAERKERFKNPRVQTLSRNKELLSDSQVQPVTFHFHHDHALCFQWQWPALGGALRELVTQMCHWKGSFLPKCCSASLQRVCVPLAPHLPLLTPSLTVCSAAQDLLGAGVYYLPKN